MSRFLKSPLVRISFGLTMLTVSMLLISDFIGLMPDTKSAKLQSRKVIAESLAVQLSTEIAGQKLHSIKEILRTVVERNKNVLSGAVRLSEGELLSEYGQHSKYWTLQIGDNSTATQVQVPLFNEADHWGSVELRFKGLTDKGDWFSFQSSFLALILFMALAGFFTYLLFLKRTMRELNPDAVIPERVHKALDTLAEGLLIVDKDGYIVFSNSAFARKTGLTPKQLIGKESTKLDWQNDTIEDDNDELPWLRVMDGHELTKNVRIRLRTALKETYTFTVNASPITAAANNIRGALVTFDDITEIETKNDELQRTLGKLENSQHEITRQNQELQVLATRDPLTGALNRRSLFQGFETLFAEAQEQDEALSCIMVDIDHFKSVNDRFGHAAGDKVIKLLAKILTQRSRPNDLVGRFGGEEFCVVLPAADAEIAAEVAERMRQAIQEGEGSKLTSAIRITSSFGVSTLNNRTNNYNDMLELADKALYTAKEQGRNRVIIWTNALEEDTSAGESTALPVQMTSDDVGALTSENNSSVEEMSLFTQSSLDRSQEQDNKEVGILPQNLDLLEATQQNKERMFSKQRSSEEVFTSNIMLLVDRIGQAIRRAERFGNQVAVMVIEIDALQRVSDTLGLAVNKKFAATIVARLKQMLRDTDTVAMTDENELLFSISLLGRSEIVVLLTDLKQNEVVSAILQRIFSVHNEPVEVEGNELYLNSNVGVSLFPFDGEDPDTLIRNASSAMHEAKQSLGRNSFCFYSDDINQRSKTQFRLEAELHRAIEREELTVYYQPKIDLKTGSIMGMEALVRWQHPQLGIVPPNDFIPLAEQMGLIDEISHCVIRSACRQIRFWQEAGYGTVTVAINFSPMEFRNPGLDKKIIDLVDEFDIPASVLEVEITETVVMHNIDTAVGILEKLNNAGVHISLDDFGTGYSSLSYLKRFPLSKVKIDRSFISGFTQDSNDAAIVSAIIAMSHSLGLRVVAEGVETEEQLLFLQDLHCDEMQGYLVSKPVPKEEASDLLAQSSSIQRMIQEFGVNYTELTDPQVVGSGSGMIGILNEFPVKGKGSINHEVSRIAPI